MKFIDKIVGKFGTDKLLHFAFGGWVAGMFSLFGWYGILAGFIASLVLSFVKEAFFDSKFDSKDLIAGTFGALTSVAVFGIIFLISLLF